MNLDHTRFRVLVMGCIVKVNAVADMFTDEQYPMQLTDSRNCVVNSYE